MTSSFALKLHHLSAKYSPVSSILSISSQSKGFKKQSELHRLKSRLSSQRALISSHPKRKAWWAKTSIGHLVAGKRFHLTRPVRCLSCNTQVVWDCKSLQLIIKSLCPSADWKGLNLQMRQLACSQMLSWSAKQTLTCKRCQSLLLKTL